MSQQVTDTMALARAQERLRQIREAFEQNKRHNARWFVVQLAMAWLAFILLPTVLIVCSWIVFHHAEFDSSIVTFAGGGLFADSIGLVVSLWRVVLGRGVPALTPVIGAAETLE